MKSIRQLIRQPLRSVMGLAFIAAAVSVLCICLAQSIIASGMEEKLEDIYTSVALLTNKHQYSVSRDENGNNYYDESGNVVYEIAYTLPEDVREWIADTAEQYPNIVQQIHRSGFVSAYIPELLQDNVANHLVNRGSGTDYFNGISGTDNHDGIMAVITLESVGEVTQYQKGQSMLTATGQIDQVIGLDETYPDPNGFTARIRLLIPEGTSADDLGLETGKQYLVNGTQYSDLDWGLRCLVAVEAYGVVNSWQGQEVVIPPQIEKFIPENLVRLSEDNIRAYSRNGENAVYQVAFYIHDEVQEDGSVIQRCVNLTNLDMEKYRSVLFYLELEGEEPSIVELNSAAADFLKSEEGAAWQQSLDYIQTNAHTFPVVGVDNLMAIGDFAMEKAYITQGRNFTEEELAEGLAVCILSEQVASANGLAVGDRIDILFYENRDPEQPGVEEGIGVVNPCAYRFGDGSVMAEEAVRYTVVGLYSEDMPWQAASSMGEFTSNTIFVPKASVAAEMDFSDLGIFQSIVMHNGMLDEFRELALRDGHEGLFEFTDQGYETVKSGLHDYQAVAHQALLVGAGVYMLILLLYLVLFPGQQGKNLNTMASLGASYAEQMQHMMLTSFGVVGFGTLLGLGLGCALWDQVVGTLMESVDSVFVLELDVGLMLGIAAVQFCAAMAVSFAVSLPMVHRREHMASRGILKNSFNQIRQAKLKSSAVLVFAAVISAVLCGLYAANEDEYESYEKSWQEAPVKVTLVTMGDYDPYNLNANAFVRNLFADTRFERYSPQKYLKEIQLISDAQTASINEETVPMKFVGLRSTTIPADLKITWKDGYEPTVLDDRSTVLIVPESWILTDDDKTVEGIQLRVSFSADALAEDTENVFWLNATVVGTHNQQNVIYSARDWLDACSQALEMKLFVGKLDGVYNTAESRQETVTGITSKAEVLNLSAQRNCEITWMDGYSSECLDGEDMVVLLPSVRQLKDLDDNTDGTQTLLKFSQKVPDGRNSDGSTRFRVSKYEVMATVAGIYTNSIGSQDIYCSYRALEQAVSRVGQTLGLDYISATMKNNSEISDLRTMADQWFADPDKELDLTKKFVYALDIDDSTLDQLKQTLENSILINNICTVLVFILTAGAGFFLGFLMVRSRKREIILMRTLGKPNGRIYRDFALEQMLWLMAGIVLGGAVFLWKPLPRLALFALLYFTGLSGALLLFLNSRLLTTIKEDD